MFKYRWDKIHIVLEIVVIAAILAMLLHPLKGNDYRRFETDTLKYVQATVQDIVSEELEDSKLKTGQQLGVQTILAKLEDGSTVKIENYLTETHNIIVKKGQRIIVCADMPKNAQPYYTVYNYDRMPGLICLVVVFLGLMLIVGKRKGMDAALSILFSLAMILCITLPVIYNGGSPVLVGFLTVLCSTAVTLLLLQGITIQSCLGIGVTILGEGAACILFAVFSKMLHLTGFQAGDAEGLLLIAQNTGLNVRTLLFAGAMIASLGAVMDVAVSILSALREVASVSKSVPRHELFRAGMNIGRDMIGTMSNTLIFAFAGSALTTMLVFYSYGVQFHQLLSSDYLTVELAQGLCSTAAVILTVPAAALVGSVVMAGEKKAGSTRKRLESDKTRD